MTGNQNYVALRQRAVQLRRTENLPTAQIALIVGVSKKTATRWLAGEKPSTQPRAVRARLLSEKAPGNNEAVAATRCERAFELRLQGLSIPEVARRMNVNAPQVRTWISDQIEQRITAKVEELREIELNRLDLYLARLEPRLAEGNDKAINAALRISERRARLLGLDAPVRLDATVLQETEADRELREMINEAKARSAAQEAELKQQPSP